MHVMQTTYKMLCRVAERKKNSIIHSFLAMVTSIEKELIESA